MADFETEHFTAAAVPVRETVPFWDLLNSMEFRAGSVVDANITLDLNVDVGMGGLYDVRALAWANGAMTTRQVQLLVIRGGEQTTLDTLPVKAATAARSFIRAGPHRVALKGGDRVRLRLPGGGAPGDNLEGQLWVRRVY